MLDLYHFIWVVFLKGKRYLKFYWNHLQLGHPQIWGRKMDKALSYDDVLLVKPETYMNNSGVSVQSILAYYKLLPKQFGLIRKKGIDLTNFLTVVHDEKDIEIGKYKISLDSRSAGHRGVESIINNLKTQNFKRIRIGIKSQLLERMAIKDFVLKKFAINEMALADAAIEEAIKKELKVM